MKIIGVAIVKDESELVEYTIRHLLAHGIDRLLIIDHASRDGTSEILSSLASETGQLEVERKEEPVFLQEVWTNYLIAIAGKKHGATWIVPFDADEIFIPLTQSTIAEELRTVESGVFVVQSFAYVNLFQRATDAQCLKCIFSWIEGCTINKGAHSVCGHVGPIMCDRIKIAERRYLNSAHFIKRVRKHIASRDVNLPSHSGLQYQLLRNKTDVQLENEYEKMVRACSVITDPIQISPITTLYSNLVTTSREEVMMTEKQKMAVAIYDGGSGIEKLFKEVAETVMYGLKELGHDTILTNELESIERRTILFNPNMFASFHTQLAFPAPLPYSTAAKRLPQLPTNTIFYNLEPFGLDYLLLIVKKCKYEVWDYSEENVKWWKEHDVNAKHVPIGYASELTRIKSTEKEVDVLFYGGAGRPELAKKYNPSRHERRLHVLWQCEQAGLRTKHLSDTFGEERDKWIAKSKIVLNVHRILGNEWKPASSDETIRKLETVRVSYLLANGACVVSEESTGVDGLDSAVVFAEYAKLADTCVRLVKDGSWEERGKKGLEVFREMREGEILNGVMMIEKVSG
jgi:Glycosyl transferase family 2